MSRVSELLKRSNLFNGCFRDGFGSRECVLRTVRRRLPIVKWLPAITLNSFLFDLAGGLTVGLTAIPQSLAYAQLASMPLENGLYTTIVSGFTYCVLGTARDVNLGPTSLISLLTGGIVDDVGALVHSLLCFFTGIIMIAFAFLRIEIFLNVFPITVTTGFTSAAAILIICSQLKYFFGLSSLPRPFIELVPQFFTKLNQTNLYDFTGGVLVLFFLLLVQHTFPLIQKALSRKNQTPFIKTVSVSLNVFSTLRAIIAIVVSTGIAYSLVTQAVPTTTTAVSGVQNCSSASNLSFPMVGNCSSGVMKATVVNQPKPKGLTLTGPVPRGVPRPEMPPFNGMWVKAKTEKSPSAGNSSSNSSSSARNGQEFWTFEQIMQKINIGVIIIPLISTIELLAIGRALATRNGYVLDASQDMFAAGTAHVIGAFLNAYPSSASVTRSALNSQCQVKSQLCSFFTAALVLIAASTVADTCLPYVPKSCLAAVVMAAALSMVETDMTINIWRINRIDILPTAITFIACMVLDIEYGVLVGVGSAMLISAILSMRSVRTAITFKETALTGLPNNQQQCLLVTIPHGELRYSCADAIKKFWPRTSSFEGPVVLDCSDLREIDFATLIGLLHLGKQGLEKQPYPLCMVGLKGALLDKFRQAAKVLEISPPAYRSLHFATNIQTTASIFDSLPSSSVTSSLEEADAVGDGLELVDFDAAGGYLEALEKKRQQQKKATMANQPLVPVGSNLAALLEEGVSDDSASKSRRRSF